MDACVAGLDHRPRPRGAAANAEDRRLVHRRWGRHLACERRRGVELRYFHCWQRRPPAGHARGVLAAATYPHLWGGIPEARYLAAVRRGTLTTKGTKGHEGSTFASCPFVPFVVEGQRAFSSEL